MAKILTVLAMLLAAASSLLGLIEPGAAALFCVAAGLIFYAIDRKVSAWGVMVLCALSASTMAAGMDADAIGIFEAIYNATANWSGWPIIGLALGVIHTVALLWVNLTETPDDDNRYGRIYKRFIEPLAGILAGGKAKQLPFSKRW